jgi:PAS domain S-box-containing protein
MLLAVLIALVALAYGNFRRLAEANRWRGHAYTVLAEAERLAEALATTEAALRAPRLAGSPRSAVAAFERHLGAALRLTGGDSLQNRRLRRVGEMYREWVAEERRASGPAPTESARVAEMQHLLHEVIVAESEMLGRRTERAAVLERQTGGLLLGGGIFAVVLAAGLAWMVGGRNRRLKQANRALAAEVAEREQAEREAERLARENDLILDAVEEGIYGVDVHGYTVFLNPAAARLLGHDAAELIGRPLEAVLQFERAADGSGGTDAVRETLRTGTPRRGAATSLRRAGGGRFPVEFACSPLREDGRIVGAVVTFRDVTERREVDRMKDEFISIVSHELRTPLTSIRGSLGLLSGGQLGELNERGRRLLEIALQNTDRLVRLINDILDIERIEAGRAALELRVHDAAALARAAADVMEPMADRAGVALRVHAETVPVRADGDRILQVLTNLLSNAVKFSPAGTEVVLACERQDGSVAFRVSDRGRGIPAESLESVFERFQQVDSSDSRQKGGTGLGLAISRSIVQQHGGRIWAESAPGQGTTFRFTLPVREAPGEDDTGSVGPGVGVLAWCPDPALRARVALGLEGWGFRVTGAASAAEVREEAARLRPDVLLVGAGAHGPEEEEPVAWLRAGPGTRGLPVVAVGAGAPADVEARVDDPADEAALLRAVEGALRQRRRRVLLVEDDDGLAGVMAELFARHGVETVRAASGGEAAGVGASAAPDMVVLDVALPGGDGFWVVEALRRDPRLRDSPLVVYAAQEVEAADRPRLRLGPTEFLTKGRVGPDELEKRVIALLNRQVPGTGRGENGNETNPGS